MKISFFMNNSFPSVSFRSIWDLDESFFEDLDTTGKLSPNEKDVFVSTNKPEKRKKIQKTLKTEQEFSLQRIISIFLSHRKDIQDKKAVELAAKGAYLYALRAFPENLEERNNKMSEYISKRLEEKFPQTELKVNVAEYKAADDKKETEELNEHILRCKVLYNMYGKTLSANHQKILLQYCENNGDCKPIVLETGRTMQHVKESITRIVKKLENLDKRKSIVKPYDDKVLDVIKYILKGEVSESNREEMLEKFASAFLTLTPMQKQFLHSHYLSTNLNPDEGVHNDMPMKFHPDTKSHTVAILRKKMGIKKEFSAREFLAMTERYSERFSDTEKKFIKIRYKDPDNPVKIKQMVDIMDMPYKKLCCLNKVITSKLKRISCDSTKAERQLEKRNIVNEFYASRNHLLSPVQKKIVEIIHFSNPPKSMQQTCKILKMPFATMRNHYNDALKILKGEIFLSKELIKKEEEEELNKLFNEKRFFFSKRQQDLFTQLFTNGQKRQKEIALQNGLRECTLKKFKGNIIQVLQNVSVEDYLTARAKLKLDVESALSQKKLKNDKKIELLNRYILSDTPRDLDDIGRELKLYIPRAILKQTLMELGIKTDLPNFIL